MCALSTHTGHYNRTCGVLTVTHNVVGDGTLNTCVSGRAEHRDYCEWSIYSHTHTHSSLLVVVLV